MDKAAKAESRIKSVCDSYGISEPGRKWLNVALDPFKDILEKPQGYPDRIGAASVVQTVHSSLDVSAPSGTLGNWDANIFLDHAWNSTELFKTNKTNPPSHSSFNVVGQAAGPGFKRGGLVVRAANAGTVLNITTTQNAYCESYAMDVFENDTSSRIIAIGLEIHNTTAEINKQGSIITYRVSDEPDTSTTSICRDQSTVGNNSTYKTLELVDPPQTAAEAIDLPGSLQWEAKAGAYIVPVFNEENNPPSDHRDLLIFEQEVTTSEMYLPRLYTEAVSSYSPDCVNMHVPITVSGAFLTGLSKETTLTVNLCYYVEQFPSWKSTMHRISTPSCPEDFKAIELYTKVVRKLPTGVEVNDNFLGAFVTGVSRLLAMAMPHIPKMITLASGVGTAISTTKAIVDANRPRQQQQIVVRQPENSIIPTILDAGTNLIRAYNDTNKQPQQQHQRQPNNNSPRRTSKQSVVKNRRDPNYNRFDRYIKASNAGNRTLM